jgi:hypothetical protein
MHDPEPNHDEISRHAEELWRQRGSPQGRDDEIWLEAERNLKRREAAGNPRFPDIAEPSPRQSPGLSGSPRSDTDSRGRTGSRPLGDGKLVRDKTRD